MDFFPPLVNKRCLCNVVVIFKFDGTCWKELSVLCRQSSFSRIPESSMVGQWLVVRSLGIRYGDMLVFDGFSLFFDRFHTFIVYLEPTAPAPLPPDMRPSALITSSSSSSSAALSPAVLCLLGCG